MQILQAICNVNQLRDISQLLVYVGGVTHKHRAVGKSVFLNELVDVSIIRPLRNHRKPMFAYRDPKQREDIWMPEMFPSNSLSAEPLQRVHTYKREYEQKTHADEVVHVTGEVCVENLDRHANPFVHTFPYSGRTSTCSLHGALRAIWDIH